MERLYRIPICIANYNIFKQHPIAVNAEPRTMTDCTIRGEESSYSQGHIFMAMEPILRAYSRAFNRALNARALTRVVNNTKLVKRACTFGSTVIKSYPQV